jgi:oxygen-independent coproporphyrinogen-3 oxidase
MMGIYVHIPFCRTICPYCDFVRSAITGSVPESYIDALLQEIEACEGSTAANSIFFGGGTPSLLTPEALARILDALHKRFDLTNAEITLEANPDDVTADLVATWRDAGINRVSLGVQSFHEATLEYLGRRHDAEAAHKACDIIAARFPNWSMDLIFGADESPLTWESTLTGCLQHDPPHISAYGLTYEAGTPFAKRSHEAIGDEEYLAVYGLTGEMFAAAGRMRYEVSNYARPGMESRHNLVYWHNEDYAGFGTAAYSYVDGVRGRNHRALKDYLENPGGKCEALTLSDAEIRVETVIQHLRLAAGIEKSAYQRRFGKELYADFRDPLASLVNRGLIEDSGEALRPTAQGFQLNNEIGIALVSPETSASY